MPNPIFNALNNGFQNRPLGNLSNLLTQFNQFSSNFQGDPKQKVQELLESGQMSKAQFDQLAPIAQQLQNVFRR